MKTGNIIKLLRMAKDLSQGDFARHLGITRAYLSQIENGRRQTSLSFLKEVSRQLDVPLSLLVLGEEEQNKDNFLIQELYKLLGKLLATKSTLISEGIEFELGITPHEET